MRLNQPILAQMQSIIEYWESIADDKALFLRCYQMMTGNVLDAVDMRDFNDPIWVNELLNHFAHYYYIALEAYEKDPASAPPVWQLAHNATADPNITPLQKLLLGVNAHINYDLVLTLVDLLRPDWAGYTEHQKASRYADHCRINHIIGQTIDSVQDQILEPAMPVMAWIDTILGPVDELLISGLIARWREDVWENAACLLEIHDPEKENQFIQQFEAQTLAIGKLIAGS